MQITLHPKPFAIANDVQESTTERQKFGFAPATLSISEFRNGLEIIDYFLLCGL